MDSATLVNLDLELGARVVSVLEAAHVHLNVALWMTSSEYEEGRLVLASDDLDQADPLRAYKKVAETLQGHFSMALPLMLILRMQDPFIAALRTIFGKTHSVEGMRLGGQQIGNRFVSMAYVYKIQ